MAYARNKITSGESGNHFWQVSGIVLSIAIERGDDRRGGIADAGPESGALAGVALVSQTVNDGIGARRIGDAPPCFIGATVVNEDQLIEPVVTAHGFGDFLNEGNDVRSFVTDGNDDVDLDGHG